MVLPGVLQYCSSMDQKFFLEKIYFNSSSSDGTKAKSNTDSDYESDDERQRFVDIQYVQEAIW